MYTCAYRYEVEEKIMRTKYEHWKHKLSNCILRGIREYFLILKKLNLCVLTSLFQEFIDLKIF